MEMRLSKFTCALSFAMLAGLAVASASAYAESGEPEMHTLGAGEHVTGNDEGRHHHRNRHAAADNEGGDGHDRPADSIKAIMTMAAMTGRLDLAIAVAQVASPQAGSNLAGPIAAPPMQKGLSASFRI